MLQVHQWFQNRRYKATRDAKRLKKTNNNAELSGEVSDIQQRVRSPVVPDIDDSTDSSQSYEYQPQISNPLMSAPVQQVFQTTGTHVVLSSPNPQIFDTHMSGRLLSLFNININEPGLYNYELNEMFKISHDVCYVVFNDQVKICKQILMNEFSLCVRNIIVDQSMSINTNSIINAIKGLHETALEKHILSLVFSKENLLFHLRKRNYLTENSVSRYNQYRSKLIVAHNDFQFSRMLFYNQLSSIMAYEKTHHMLIKFPSVFINEHTKTINSLQNLDNKFNEVLSAMGRFP
jgi:hypothetical protein